MAFKMLFTLLSFNSFLLKYYSLYSVNMKRPLLTGKIYSDAILSNRPPYLYLLAVHYNDVKISLPHVEA